jgi:hypothetical protein
MEDKNITAFYAVEREFALMVNERVVVYRVAVLKYVNIIC